MMSQERLESPSPGSFISLRDKLIAIEAWLFVRRRTWLYGSGVPVAYSIGLAARLFTHTWIFAADGKLSCIDFSNYWLGGILAGSGAPALTYSFSAFSATRVGLGGGECT
jgi:hypothetical protein